MPIRRTLIRAIRQPACRRFGPEVAPFDDTYVVHLGEELDADGFAAAADKLATYLYYRSLTSAAEFFDAAAAAPQRRLGPEE